MGLAGLCHLLTQALVATWWGGRALFLVTCHTTPMPVLHFTLPSRAEGGIRHDLPSYYEGQLLLPHASTYYLS